MIALISLIFVRNNLINFLIIIELIFLLLVIIFCLTSYNSNNSFGLIYSILIIVVAACETSVGLILIINFYKLKGNILFKNISLLK